MLLCIISSNFRLIPDILKELELERRPSDLVKKPIMENFKVPWNKQKLPEHGHFEKQYASCYCALSHQISGQ